MKAKQQQGETTTPVIPTFGTPEFDKLVKSEWDRGFQKALKEWKAKEEKARLGYASLKANLKTLKADPTKIQEVAVKHPEQLEDILDVLGKEHFESDGKKVEFVVPQSTRSKTEEEIIAEYEASKQQEGKIYKIESLLWKIDSQIEYDTEDERESFHNELKGLLSKADDEEQMQKLANLLVKEKINEDLKYQVVNNQKVAVSPTSPETPGDQPDDIKNFLALHGM